MKNDDQFDDLKQFIANTVSQTKQRIVKKIDKIEQKVDDGFARVGEVVDSIHSNNDEIATRVTNVEQKAA
jgi:hypothetical protein